MAATATTAGGGEPKGWRSPVRFTAVAEANIDIEFVIAKTDVNAKTSDAKTFAMAFNRGIESIIRRFGVDGAECG